MDPSQPWNPGEFLISYELSRAINANYFFHAGSRRSEIAFDRERDSEPESAAAGHAGDLKKKQSRH